MVEPGRTVRPRASTGALVVVVGGALLLAGCATPRYEPCPVELAAPLPADAFARCREVLLRGYPKLAVADAEAFRLQSDWVAVVDPPGERRATVFREPGAADGGLAVVVELRWLTVPWFGTPGWTAPRGDPAAERALAAELEAALRADPVAGR